MFVEKSNTLLCLCVPAPLVSLGLHDATVPRYIQRGQTIL